jgi:uncharacterized protein (UPF0333 family)
VDTAALTGEPFPRKVPDPRDKEGKSHLLLSGFVVRQGEAYARVDFTGLKTEIGQAAQLIKEAGGPQEGLFEGQIYLFTKAIIAITIIDVIVVAWFQIQVRDQAIDDTLLVALSITIASVPIALPMVMTITQAIGAQNMAKESVIVTHLGALQEIASMTVLCSDKTGTLTTAQITIFPEVMMMMMMMMMMMLMLLLLLMMMKMKMMIHDDDDDDDDDDDVDDDRRRSPPSASTTSSRCSCSRAWRRIRTTRMTPSTRRLPARSTASSRSPRRSAPSGRCATTQDSSNAVPNDSYVSLVMILMFF